MISIKFKNLFYIAFASVCLFLLGISVFNYSLFPDLRLKVFAEMLNSTEYFSAKVENTEYQHGQTIFLSGGETLKINFGKPIGEPYGTTENVFISEEEIGNYTLSFLSGSFSLSINGILVDISDYIDNNKISIKQFIYSPEYETEPDSGTEFQYLTMSINLSETVFFPSGEYIITFNKYIEHSGADYGISAEKNFSTTFYVFKTTEYFVSEDARDALIEKQNLREVPKVDVNYKNYYYFNYSNYTSASNLYNFLPSISFDANKFIIEISKSYQGVTQTCTVSKFASNYITLGTNTQTKFLFVTYNSDNNNLSIIFKDLGEYSIKYKFIYTKSYGNYENLTNANIATFKKDMLYVFGYQMFYSDINTQQKSEFKYIDIEEGKTNISADVSYMLPYQNLKSTDIGLLASDDFILDALDGKTATSSNQPVISMQYNVNLNINSSYYYVWDSKTNDWKKESDKYVKKTYTNSAFADAGKYLLKVVYSYDKNLTENGVVAPNEYFVQYFYFTISNTITSFSVREIITDESEDITENILSTNSYTQNPVKVILNGQSRFNSDVWLVIESKNYTSNLYTPDMVLYGSTTEQIFDTSRNLNYKVTLYFGSNKTQTSYFTIDNNEFQDIQILNVKKSVSSSSYYVKDSEVSFFTNQAVTLQWSEKLSGASSTAYSKFIPFKSSDHVLPSLNQLQADFGIPTNYSLNFDVLDKPAFTRYYNSKSMSLITDKYVFSQQGLYVIYLTDEAGNDEYISFCIDKTEITIWQYSKDKYQTVQRYNVVSADTTLQWGRYKLINMGLKHNQIDSIEDEWIKKIIKDKLENDDDIIISSFNNGLLYLAPEIHKTMYLQEGASYTKLENKISYEIKLEQEINDTMLAIEMTYVFYFIDESNPYYNKVSNLPVADFANYASKNYSITTSSDASQADILFNPSSISSLDYSNINFNSANLSQAGFTDSYSYASDEYSDNLDIRSKYYYATGTTAQGNISLLSYIFIKNPSEKIIMDKVAIYYYSFITTSDNQYKLSDTAVETIIYDRTSNLDFTNDLSGDFAGFQAYNINPEFNLALNQYQTKEGKYVIVRTYTSDSIVKKYDFLTRESVFVVDRQNIVSSPVTISNKLVSIIGQFIHINVLDGDVNKVKFNDLYRAYYNSGEILETNKLPVVSYIPVSKYGTGTDISFSFYNSLQYFYTMTSDSENYYLERFQTNLTNEQSKLGLSYFGQNALIKEDFKSSNNLKKINNSSFDLTVKIEYATEKNAERTLKYTGTNSRDGYFASDLFVQEGYYYVTLTQNYANGNTYPNVRNTFSFVFYISRLVPQFDFLDSNDEILNNMENGEYNVSYTNENSVKVFWTDHSSEFMAKININDDERGNAQGIWYYTNRNSTKQFIPLSNIISNDRDHYFILNLANMTDSTIVYVYMEYEGSIPNNYSKVTKALYIDRQAPTKVLNELIASTETNGIAIGGYSRIYVDENNLPTTTEQKYNVSITEGPLAFYTFAVELNQENLNRLFSTQSPVGNYYTEGYYYYAKEIGSSGNMFVTDIGSAKNAFATHSEYFVVTSLNIGRIYEIVEQDLAGNITIYSIYFVLPNSDENVLEFIKPATEHNTQTNIKYGDLQQTQNIFAKDNFEITNINLYNYEWLVISVNGTIYLTTPYINKNSYYDISHWTDRETEPTIYTLSEILKFKNDSRTIQKLIVVEPCKNFNYNFNISVTNEILNSDSLSDNLEGIKIKGISYLNGISVYLSAIQIYSWGNNIYNKIYDATTTFFSNNYITFSSKVNEWTFTINQPLVAYKYVFIDNYGVSYVHYHTFEEPVINEEDRIIGDVEQVSILNDDGLSSTIWNVGYNNMSYYYSNVDYYIYIKVLYLDYNAEAKVFSWKTFDPAGATNEYGTFLEKGMSSAYYSCVGVSGQPSINCINLFASASTYNLTGFKGSAVKFIITLVNVNENPNVALDPSNVIQAHLLINNLNPIIELFDKNNENKSNLFDGDTLFSGQLTIRYGSLNFNNQAIFPFKIVLQINNENEIAINSGTVIDVAGFHIIKTYITINNVDYLYKTQAFIISESSKDFYNVVVLNSQTGIWEPKASTGKTFKYNNETYSSHYIVNSENYKISINEEQDIKATEFDFTYNRGGTLTRFYKISNRGSQSNSINFYEKTIAITYAKTENLITTAFYYISADGQQLDLNGISTQIIITTNNQNFVSSRIIYNSYFGIPENKINITVYFGETQPQLYIPVKQVISDTINAIILTEPGTYSIYLSDQAGNKHSFKDEQYNYPSSSYQIVYINGVMYQINGKQPIENGIYNDEVEITLPTTFDTLYDPGGKPIINVFKNGVALNVSAVDGKYTLNQPGYYQVYFSAKIESNDVRHQSYSFTILDSTEARWAFEFSEFANYEITSVKKNGSIIDLSKYFKHNTYKIQNNDATLTVKYLKHIFISLFDETTGVGDYEITIRTNIGIEGQDFTFSFKIKDTSILPITVSVLEGTATTSIITVNFNALILFNTVGNCTVKIDDRTSIVLNNESINKITDYNITKEITRNGTNFVQIITSSGKVVYSYKIIKEEPLNAVSIIIIIGSILAVSGLIVTITLLRRRMKVR